MASQANNLQKMFASDEWNESQWARRADGKDTKKKVNDPRFCCENCLLRLLDQAKEQIKAAYKDRCPSMGLFGTSLIVDGTINSIALYMQLGR
jgi:hypothetical protein